MIDGISEYSPGLLPMHRADDLAEWIAPGWGPRLLRNAIDGGGVHVFARFPPPATGVAITETRDDGTVAAPEWLNSWTDGPLHPNQVAWARVAANMPQTGWERWFDHLVGVDHAALAEAIDSEVASAITDRGPAARQMWNAVEAVAWIATRDSHLVECLFADQGCAKRWINPWRALIWRLAWQDGTWRDLPGGDAPAALVACKKLLEALRTKSLSAALRVDGKPRAAEPADFAFPIFDAMATTLDLASGSEVRIDAREVQRLWPLGGQDQPRGRPKEIDRDAVVARAIALKNECPGISKNKVAISICAELPANPSTGKPRDPQGIKRTIAHLWQG